MSRIITGGPEMLTDALDDFGHLPILDMRYARTPSCEHVDVRFETCAAFTEACRIAKVKPTDRLTSHSMHRAYEAVTKGDGILSHHCFPHLECWS